MSELALKKIREAKHKCSKALDLGNCGLTSIPEELFELTDLVTLNLCNRYWDYDLENWSSGLIKGKANFITEIPDELSQLTELKILRLGGDNHLGKWRVADIDVLSNLKSLVILSLSYTSVNNISSLSGLSHLESLDLSYSFVKDFGPLEKVKNLKRIFINGNNLIDVSPLKIFKKIDTLYLNNNKLTDIDQLKELDQLKTLDLSENKIVRINSLSKLNNLNKLFLSNNKIENLKPISNLTKLKYLYLRRNRIKKIDSLEKLNDLFVLNLNDNQINDLLPLFSLINKGANLVLSLYPSKNEISVKNNPIKSPPLEIINKGNVDVFEYFIELNKQGSDHLYEAKMLIVGEGGVGKTSLAKKLIDHNAELPEEEDTTKGIDILQKTFPIKDAKDFTMNMWDFGGQEIYHSTHQFFLTKRSLYVLVDDTRKDDSSVNDASFKYWLQTAELFGGGSPLIIVQNQKGDRSKDIDIKSMQKQFDFIKDRYQTNLKTTEGLGKLEKGIQHHISQLPHIGEKLPKQWVKIRNELNELSKKNPTFLGKTILVFV